MLSAVEEVIIAWVAAGFTQGEEMNSDQGAAKSGYVDFKCLAKNDRQRLLGIYL